MAWGTEGRNLPSDWKAIVKEVWKRDGGQCRWILPKSGTRCPRPGSDVDHRYGPNRHKLEDLWLLCRTHHDRKTAKEATFGRTRYKKAKKRTPERQPGSLR